MSRLTEWAFRNRAAVILLIIMALGLGGMSYAKLPMEFLPKMDVPQVQVTVIAPGYDAKSVEKLVTGPIENAVQYTKGKSDMFSTTGNGYASVQIAFDSKTKMKDAKAEIEKSVDSVQLPERVMKPFVVQFDTSMIPISWVALTFDEGISDTDKEQRVKEIEAELKKAEGAGQVSVSGRTAPEISITPITAKLAEKKVTTQAIMGVLQSRGVAASIGEQNIAGAASNVNVNATISDLDTLRKLPVAPGVALSDVATVELSKKQESIGRVNGKDTIMITVSKSANANAVTVGKNVQTIVDDVNKVGKGVEASVMISTSDQVVSSVNSMLQEVLMGALFATVVILLFMRNIKATIITIVSIPLSLGITLYLLQISGVSLNIITLGGVAVAVGRLVDDSIVVIENIYRRLQKESFSMKLIVEATKEVSVAITSSTLVTVAVFLPMALLRGSLQAMLLPFALTVGYSLLASLIVALTVVPVLSAVLLRGTKMKEHEGSKRFAAFLAWNLKHKWVTILVALVLLVGSVGIYFGMPKGALDSSSADMLDVKLEYPSDTQTDKVLANGTKLEQFLTKHESVKWVFMTYGNSEDGAKYGNVSSPTVVSYMIDVKDGADAEKLMADTKAQKANLEGGEIEANATALISSGGGGSSVYVDVTGDNVADLEKTATALMASVKDVDGILKVSSNQEQKKPVYTFQVDPLKARGQDVAMQLQGMLNPIPVGSINLEGRDSAVIMQPIVKADSEQNLNGLTVMTDAGPTPITQIAKLVKSEEPSLYYHKDGKVYVRVTAQVDPDKLSVVGADIQKKVDGLTVPKDVKVIVGGASVDQSGDMADLAMTALISILIVYLIMVITFKTLRAPLAILVSLPLAAIGAVIGLLVSNVTPDFTAMFGALMLIGIVVTNAIVLIDRVKQNEKTMSIRDSLIEAATTRMRPIVMTAIATVSAMLPLVFGSHEGGSSIVSQSLAIVVIGGLTAATLLTLVVVPCVYELFFFRKSRKQRREASAKVVTDTRTKPVTQ
ncbi:efflux RND transporter permease subunit [Paenibacillus sp. MMS18-CY102]|uniref:efflux RND transporter permease subunit n=1 Tax=Paenibacillus sp. MMS18-CY102 TaxID=2682849 RepID=UPI0013655B72|nr:efflux RND transporter permease subunit [Paenibacillus sp. MMS18-CY102]MWC26783.1 AcrB/AcrD/AcrF family protein [Paenibacillus sp. MMS18-CY102]